MKIELPEQFEILNANNYRTSDTVSIKEHGLVKDKDGIINGKPKYVRMLIKYTSKWISKHSIDFNKISNSY